MMRPIKQRITDCVAEGGEWQPNPPMCTKDGHALIMVDELICAEGQDGVECTVFYNDRHIGEIGFKKLKIRDELQYM